MEEEPRWSLEEEVPLAGGGVGLPGRRSRGGAWRRRWSRADGKEESGCREGGAEVDDRRSLEEEVCSFFKIILCLVIFLQKSYSQRLNFVLGYEYNHKFSHHFFRRGSLLIDRDKIEK